jgi:hypothetical protein
LDDGPLVATAVSAALEGALALEPSLFVEGRIKLLIGLAKGLAAPARDRAGGVK